MARSSRICRRSDFHFWSDVAHYHWAAYKCNRALCKMFQGAIKQEYLRALHSDKNMKIMHIHLRFFIGLDPCVDCHHCYGRSRSLESLQLSRAQVLLTWHMHGSSRVDHEMSLFQLCRRACRHQASVRVRWESRMCLLTFWGFFRRLCGRTAPVLGFRVAFFLRIWELMDFAPGVRTFEWSPVMDPSFPDFLRDASRPSRTWLCDSIPNFPFSRRIAFFWGLSSDTQPNWIVSFKKATDPFAPPFFDFSLSCPPASVFRNIHLSPYLHQDSDLWFKHMGGYQKSRDVSVHVPAKKNLHGLLLFNPEGLSPLRLPYLRGFLPSVCVGTLEGEEDDCARWPEWDPSWLILQESPLGHYPVAFHWKPSPTFLSALTILPFWPLLLYQFFHSGLWNFVSLSCDQYVVLPFFFSIFVNSAPRDLNSILGCTSQILSEVVQNLITCFCTNLRGHSLEASHLFQIKSDPILYRNLGRHHLVRECWTNPTDFELNHTLPLTESGHRSFEQFASLSRIGCTYELAALLTEWSSIAFLVNEVCWELLSMYRMCCVFLCRGRKSEWGRWSARGERQVRQPRMRHVTTDNKILFGAQRWNANRAWTLSQVLCCAARALYLWVYCLHSQSIFWRFFSRKPNLSTTDRKNYYHQSSDLEECLESQLVFHWESYHCDDEDDAACGFPRGCWKYRHPLFGSTTCRSCHRLRTVVRLWRTCWLGWMGL